MAVIKIVHKEGRGVQAYLTLRDSYAAAGQGAVKAVTTMTTYLQRVYANKTRLSKSLELSLPNPPSSQTGTIVAS
jgi:hypothetical protein